MELVVQSGADAGKVFSVGTTPLVAGRQPGVDILLNDTQVSRRHASFQIVNGSLTVTDLGSANGTTLNGQPLAANQPVLFVPGARLQLGNTTLEVRAAVNGGPPAYAGTQPAIPRPPEIQSYNQSYNASPPPAPMPGPGPAPVNPAYNNYNNAGNAGYTPPNYGVAPAPPMSPAKKGGNGLFLGIGIVVIIAVAAIVVIIILGSGNNNPGTPVANPGVTTPTPRTPQSNPTGPNGSNALPPPPPAGFGQPAQPRAAWANQSSTTNHISRVVEYNNWRL